MKMTTVFDEWYIVDSEGFFVKAPLQELKRRFYKKQSCEVFTEGGQEHAEHFTLKEAKEVVKILKEHEGFKEYPYTICKIEQEISTEIVEEIA